MMMKTLKVGLLGLAMGALGAVALASHEAHACGSMLGCAPSSPSAPSNPSPPNKALLCEMQYAVCKANANGNVISLAMCAAQRSICLSN
jgi:hypothetical protein